MSPRSVPLYLNNAKPYFSRKLNKEVLLVEPDYNEELTLRTVENRLKNTKALKLEKFLSGSMLALLGKNLNELSPLFLYCFNSETKRFQTFFTLIEAYRKLYPKNSELLIKNKKTFTGPYNYIRSRINLEVPVVAEDGINYYFAKNPQRRDSEFRENSVLWVLNLEKNQAKLYPNLKKVVDYFKSISAEDITLRICSYYKDSGKIYKNDLFLSHDVFIKVYPEASQLGMDTINLVEIFSPENLNLFLGKIKSILEKNEI